MLYLAPIIGSGTRRDAFRPAGVDDFEGWSCVSLRPGPTAVSGYALVAVTTTRTIPGLIKLAESPLERTATSTRTLLGNRLGLTLPHARRMTGVIRELLFTEDKPWNGVIPNRDGEKEVFIGGELWAFDQVEPCGDEPVDPTDTFIRADANPIGGNWTTAGTAQPLKIISNKCAGGTANADCIAYYNAFTPQNDQFAEITFASPNNADAGAVVRLDPLGATASGMTLNTSLLFTLYAIVGGSFVFVAQASVLEPGAGDTTRLTATGSSYNALKNGIAIGSPFPVTDTTFTSGRCGIHIYDPNVRLSQWQAGDIGSAPTPKPSGIIQNQAALVRASRW